MPGLVPAWLTDDPVVTYNAVLILGLWIAGLSMYALVHGWTQSTGAALVAGLLFAIEPGRIGDPTHPFVHGDLWSPLVLLAAHRLFTRRSWDAAAALAVAIALVLLESLYAIVALVLIAVVYVPYLVVRFRHQLLELAPKLAAVAVPGRAKHCLHAHLTMRADLAPRDGCLLPPSSSSPRRFYHPARWAVPVAWRLVDRPRGARALEQLADPRAVFVAGCRL
jgi:hypothetical protein